jgi:hypothetical protein
MDIIVSRGVDNVEVKISFAGERARKNIRKKESKERSEKEVKIKRRRRRRRRRRRKREGAKRRE